MQRTRHASLDYLGSNHAAFSPQEEWSEFLSTSMRALSVDEETSPDGKSDAGRMSPTSLNLSDSNSNLDAYEYAAAVDVASLTGDAELLLGPASSEKPRDGSLTSSTGSSPSGAATWRPLGRRTSSVPPPPPPPSNQFDAQFEFNLPAPGSSKKLKHANSFRDVVNSCLSSSGSSFYDSSSSDDDEEPQDHLLPGEKPPRRPSMADVDLAYADTLLATLPTHPPSINVDNRPPSLSLVKSPVLGNRKDSQTWQMQDEEFLTSPRFGPLSGSQRGSMSNLFSDGMNLLSEESDNQRSDEMESRRGRMTKDIRASSVDFTFSRPHEMNPPLPPQPEPMQRLRAKSFSYSNLYGSSSGYNPVGVYNNNSREQHMPLQPGQQEYMNSVRPMPPSVMPPQPPGPSVRPPRVSIPSDSPMHHHYHQQFAAPPVPYRRFSNDAAFQMMPPYQDTFNEQENQARHSNGGRGMRSYSMENFSFPSTRPMRSQSMEGQALFAAGPPLEYPSMNRTNSAGVNYDWPRAPMDIPSAPPLPPDVRSGNNPHYQNHPPEAYYEVEFKRGRQGMFAGRASFNPGDYVKVEADRGEDIGRIVQRVVDLMKLQGKSDPSSPVDEAMGRTKRHDLPTKKIMGIATQRELDLLSEQRKEEHEVFEVCKSKVRQRLLPMNVIDAEYQFDRHKLTFFFEADRRIDFRELVRDLFAIYKTRIWLQQVVPTGKKPCGDIESN